MRLYSKLLKLLPEHDKYVEPFGGGASLLMVKEPVSVETYIDMDGGLVNLFRVLADPERFGRFYRRVALLPYSREIYMEARKRWKREEDSIERAVLFLVVARQSFGGCFGSFGTVVTSSARGMAETCSSWTSIIDMLPRIHARLQRVPIECQDFRTILKRYSCPAYLAYCDPPYIPSTRKAGKYRFEMTDADHVDLVEILLEYDGHVMLSAYQHTIYEPLERAGWRRIDYETTCRVVGRTRITRILGKGTAKRMQPRTESVYMNYDPP